MLTTHHLKAGSLKWISEICEIEIIRAKENWNELQGRNILKMALNTCESATNW